MTRKSLLVLLLALSMVLGLVAPAMAGTIMDLNGTLVILHTNDIHGRALADASTGAIGYAQLAALAGDLSFYGASVLLLDCGDASQGTPLVNMSQGKTALEFMNAVGFDAMTPGNHEFDWGADNFIQNAEVAEFPILAANIFYKENGELVFGDNVIFDMPNGMKVGVFGLDTPETLTKTHPDKVRNVTFAQGEELYKIAQEQVDILTAQGVDLVVCVGHLGVADESAPNRSLDVIDNTKGIDIFIDGHSHTLIQEQIGDTLLTSTGEYFKNIGMIFCNAEGMVAATTYKNYNEDVLAQITAVNADVTKQLSVVFAKTEVELDGNRAPGVRTQETNLGDFAADAILWAAKKAYGDTVVAAVTNGGGIRTSIKAGDITMNDMKTVFPFGNEVTVLTVTGAELLEALEAATSTTPDAIGAFPQIAGIEMTIDTTVAYENGEQYPDSTYYKPAKPGARVTIATVGGQPFDAEALYTVATNDFTAAGGDTYYAFRYGYQTTGYKTGVSLEDALVQYVTTELGGVVGQAYAQPAGRITIK